MILVDVSTFAENLAAGITVMVFVSVGVCRFIGFSAADDAGVPVCVCIARPVGGVTAHGQHFAADIAHVVIVRVVAHTDGQLTNITTVVPVGVLVRRFLTPLPAGSAGAPMLFAVGEPPITVMVRECFTGGKGFFAADAAGTAVIVHCLCAAGGGRFEVDFVGILAVKAVGMPGCGHDFIMADRTELRGGFGGSVTRGVCRFVRLLTAIGACVPVSRGILDPSAERMPLGIPVPLPAILADRLFGAGRRAADVPAVIVAFGTPAVLPGMRFGGADDHAALASFHMGSVVTRVLLGILVPVRVLFPIGLPAFFTVRRLHTVRLAAGMLASVVTGSAHTVLIRIVRLGLYHTAAVPVFIVRGFGDILVICRPWLCVIVGVNVAEMLPADGAPCRFLAGSRPTVTVSVGGDDGSFGDNATAIPANGVAGVALLGTGRLLFVGNIGTGRIQIVIIRVDFLGDKTADLAGALCDTGCREGQRVGADTAAGRAHAVQKGVAFVRVLNGAAAAPLADMSVNIAPFVFIPDRGSDVVCVVKIALGDAAARAQAGFDGAAGCRLPIVTERRKHTLIDVAAGGAGKDLAAGVRTVRFACHRTLIEFVTVDGAVVRNRQGGVPGTAQTVIIFVVGLVFDDTAVHVSAHILRHVADRQGGVPMNLPVYDFGVHIDRAVLCRHVDHGLAVLADLPDDIGAVGEPLRDVNAENRVGVLGHRQILRVAGGRRIQRSGGCDVGDNRTEVVVHDTAVLPGRTRSDLVPAFGSGFVFVRQIFKGSAVVLTSLPPVMQILPFCFHGESIIGINDDRYFIRIGRKKVVEHLRQPVNHAFGVLGNDGQFSDCINGDRVGSAIRQLLAVCIDTVYDTDLPAFHGIGDGCRFIHGGVAFLHRFPTDAATTAQLPAVPEGNAVKGCAVGHLQARRLTVDIAIRLLQLRRIHIQGGVIVVRGSLPRKGIPIADLAPIDVSVLLLGDLREHVFKADCF